jgi:poly(3-hydroxybutyrate) depolymerase
MRRTAVGLILCGAVWSTVCAGAVAGSADGADPAVKPAAATSRLSVEALFTKFDQDKDGVLERDEVPRNVWRRIELADADNDGRITPADLAKVRLDGNGDKRAEKSARKEDRRPGGVGPAYEIRTFQSPDSKEGDELRYGWLAPKKLEPGKKYPLVVCLHGRGGNTRAADVLAENEMREKYPAFVIAPECDQPAWWAGAAVLGRGDHPEKLPQVIAAVRAVLEKEPIDPARVYVTGQSMGGVGSWAAAARHGDLFAAAVPVCGAWPVEDAAKMTAVPIWAFHGAEDATVPVKFSRELTAAVIKAGGTAKYTEYEGVGHGSWDRAYADAEMWKWMFEQRKGK